MSTPPAQPVFFAPYSASLVVVPGDDRLSDGYPTYTPGSVYSRPLDCARHIQHHLRHYLIETYWKSRQERIIPWHERGDLTVLPFAPAFQNELDFTLVKIADIQGDGFPHVRADLISDYDGVEGQLLRSEVVACLRLAIIQLRRARFMRHMNAPVLLFSFLGPQHARVIEASFDGKSFLMRPTKLFDLREDDVEAFKTLTRWYVGSPKGDTVMIG